MVGVVKLVGVGGVAAVATCGFALAHGGQYRGPGEVVPRPPVESAPPSERSGSVARPASPGVSSAAGTAPLRPAPVASSAAPAGGGFALGMDASQWQVWWEFNKDPVLRLKTAVHEPGMLVPGLPVRGGFLKPTAGQIDREVLPALAGMLETGQRDMVSGALVALAKVGKDHKDFKILDLMASRLKSGDQEIRETAALAMGISQMPRAVEYLEGLVLDDEVGHRLVESSEVDSRTRSFAAYGLGLVAWSGETKVKQSCFAILRSVLEDEELVSRDLKVAAIKAIGLLAPSATDPAQRLLLEQCLQVLESYYQRSLGAGDQLIQSHVPTAIASLLGPEGPPVLSSYYRRLFVAELRGRESGRGSGRDVGRESHDLYRSAVLALGRMGRPVDVDEPLVRAALLESHENSKDRQSRYFSLIALGQNGGAANREALLAAFDRSRDALEKSWAALALGVHAHGAYVTAERAGRNPDVDREIGRTLHRALLLRKNPEVVAALAIALGLCRYGDAADDLRELLYEHSHQDELAGYLCVGLGLMKDRRSQRDITDIVRNAVRRPDLLRQGAVALGVLGDKAVADLLQTMLVEGSQNLAKMSAVASALGLVGDRRAISPLVEVMFDETRTDLSRAFAAVALGGVVDKESLPWNAKLAAHGNYRAAVGTLTDGANGILDIL